MKGSKSRTVSNVNPTSHAVILAAGRGSRIFPFSKDTPKCLIPIHGKTILERQIEQLIECGIRKIVVVVGYKEDKIRSIIGSRFKADISFATNSDYGSTNTLYSLLSAKREIGRNSFILVDGDLICKNGAFLKLVKSDYANALLVDMEHGAGREEVKVTIDQGMRVSRLGKNINPLEANAEFIGISKLSSEGAGIFFDAAERLSEKERRSIYYDDLLDKCANRFNIYAVPVVPFKWVEMDFVVDYLEALTAFSGYKREIDAVTNIKRLPVLLTPGPVMMSESTRMALLHSDICHREQEFSEVLTKIRYNLLNLFGASNNHRYSCVILTGSGSAANESVLSSLASRVKKVLVISNGEFGERLASLADIHMKKTLLKYEWGNAVRLEDIERCLAQDQDIDMICMVHHETSTGMLNPISAVGELANKHGKLLFVDAISSLGAEPVDVERNHITFCTSAPNKAIGAPPGLSFICGEREELEKLRNYRPRVSYLDMFKHYRYEEELLQTPHTPAVQLFFALDAALNDVLSESLEERTLRHKRLAEKLRSGLKTLGLTFFIPEELTSNVLTTVNLPNGINPELLHDELREQGYIVYLGKGELRRKVFQVANIGAITEKDIVGFLHALKIVLRKLES